MFSGMRKTWLRERGKVVPAREDYVNWVYWDREIQNREISNELNLNIIYNHRIIPTEFL